MAACASSAGVLPRSLTEVMAERRPPPETWGISDPGSRRERRGAKAGRGVCTWEQKMGVWPIAQRSQVVTL